ncbi:MAG: hypothetical protein IJ638_02820 [Alphaproteobacteria bacterium]|nr:hypothetical protein [Alphaproteobacteria bacterium]
MERLSIKYCCKNKKDKTCDFSFRGLSTFVASGIMPKDAEKIAYFLLDRKNDKRIMKEWKKIQKGEKKSEKYDGILNQLEKARQISEEICVENIYAAALLDIAYYCPKCHKFQVQFGFFITWTDERGRQQIFKFEHKCRDCGAELLRLTGTSKQTSKLKCPKCGGGIEVDNSSIINVVTRY